MYIGTVRNLGTPSLNTLILQGVEPRSRDVNALLKPSHQDVMKPPNSRVQDPPMLLPMQPFPGAQEIVFLRNY